MAFICNCADFTITIINKKGIVLPFPNYSLSNAMVTLSNVINCIATKRVGTIFFKN